MADKIFFSYSRFDSAFTLRLANDLRNAGAYVWLDQLDIAAGKRWDSEIEKALAEANCVLAIISPKSLASDNAMDEISYALEEKKKVIPILLTNTETPFRLRRLQRVDFTGDYDTGFRQLLHALQLKKKELPHAAKETVQGGSNTEHTDNDEELWQSCCMANTVGSYQQYLRITTSKQHLDEAWRRLDVLQEKPLSRAIKLPQPVKQTGRIGRKKNVLLAALSILVAAIAFGAFKMITKPTPKENTSEQNIHISEPKKDSPVDKPADTMALQSSQPLNDKNAPDIQESTKPGVEKKTTVQQKNGRNTSSSLSNPENTQADATEKQPSVSPAEITITEVPGAAKRSLVINSKLIVNLLLIDNPDMHERKKTDQPVRFSVIDNVVYDGEIIIRKGATAKGTLTIGRIQTDIVIDKVDGANGNIIYLKSEKSHGRRSDVETKRTYTAIIKPGTHIEL